MIRACVFDLDGTLFDTLTTISHYCNETLLEFGLPTIPKERYRYLVGNGAKNLIKGILPEVGAEEALLEPVYEAYMARYEVAPLHLTQPYAQVLDLLSQLKKQGILLAVLSNKPQVQTTAVVESMLEKDTLNLYYGQREGVPVKPNPVGLYEILEKLGVTAEECLYIGDTSVDMQTGKNAGVKTVGVLWGFRDREELEENGADFLILEPLQLIDLL